MYSLISLLYVLFISRGFCSKWPYNRYHSHVTPKGWFVPDSARPEDLNDKKNPFIQWLSDVANTQDSGEVRSMFINNTIPRSIRNFDDLYHYLEYPKLEKKRPNETVSPVVGPLLPNFPAAEASQVFQNLGYPLDARCTADRSRWYYRTYDGSCNWLKSGEISEGQVGTAKVRDYNQHSYADGISKPRDGPNPRAVSNAFFKRNATIYYEHTPLLLGMIEFIMHDITYSQDSTQESISVSMPPDEDYFDKDTTFEVWRTLPVPGTGTSKENPRENVNMATTWLDISSLYGSTTEVAKALRSFTGGKLLTQELKTGSASKYASYLPFNTMDVPMRTRPGVDPKTLFAGGDARTNEDWLMLGIHTLVLREHNRLCDIVAKQYPNYDDERLYQTVKLVMSGKYAMMANAYQMAYWTKDMPWPRDDGFPLYRQMYGKDVMEINPMNTYPWPLVTKSGKPMVVSAEMAIVYRFHEFIISEFPIKDAKNNTLRSQNVFETGFNAKGFIETGLEDVLRGVVGTSIPNFKSGVSEAFRSAGKYRGKPFDIVTWSLVHEREQGIPTFNVYFRAYNAQDPNVEVPIRDKFEDFSSDPATVEKLKALYTHPDDVDLVVGVQLDEQYFPGTTVPKSALIISLFSLFGMGNSDRFSIGYAVTRCFLAGKPWDCQPSNALEELLWVSKPWPGFPNARWLDAFWLTELDFQAHGTNLLWRLITENSEIKCVQKAPLFPADPVTNPILCSLPKQSTWTTIQTVLLSGAEGAQALYKQNSLLVNTVLAILGSVIIYFLFEHFKANRKHSIPAIFHGWPILGEALTFQKDPRQLLLKGFEKYGQTASKVFGIKLASLKHFVITQDADLQLMLADNPYGAKFNLHAFLTAINFELIVGKENHESDLHTTLIRTHFTNPDTVARFGETIKDSANRFFAQTPLVARGSKSQHLPGIVAYLMRYITAVTGGCIVGDEVFEHPELLDLFANFNDHAVKAMGLSSLLPSFLQFLAAISIKKDFAKVRKILLPIIRNRRLKLATNTAKSCNVTFLDFILEAVEDDNRASDLVLIVVFGGLINLQATFTSLIMDIVNAPSNVRSSILKKLDDMEPSNLDVFPTSPRPELQSPWTALRAAMFESIRLSGPITGPARICEEDVVIPSSKQSERPQILPKSQVATLSAYYTHRLAKNYGNTADIWDPARFIKEDPDIGGPKWITWGLKGPHICPGRYFAQECLLVMGASLFKRYDIVPDATFNDNEKYKYSAGNVERKDVGVKISDKFSKN